MTQKTIGLDVRRGYITAVLVKRGLTGCTIEAHAHVPVRSAHPLADSLDDVLKTLGEHLEEPRDLQNATWQVAIPAADAAIRTLALPFKDPRKIRQILPFEIEPLLPWPVDELAIDFQVCQAEPDTTPPADAEDKIARVPRTGVLAAAVPHEKLQTYMDGFLAHHLDVRRVTLAGYGLARCLLDGDKPLEDTVLIDLDTHGYTFFLLANDDIRLIRTFETAAPETGPDPRQLIGNLRYTLAAHGAENGAAFVPKTVWITGPGASDAKLGTDLAHNLGISASPLHLMHLLKSRIRDYPALSWVPEQMDNALALALADTLGIEGFNFRQGRFAPAPKWLEQKRRLVKTGVILTLLLAAVFTDQMAGILRSRNRLADLDREIVRTYTETFPQSAGVIAPEIIPDEMRNKIEALKNNSTAEMESGNHVRAVDMLDALSRRIPPSIDVTLERLVMGPESLTLSGYTDTYNTVDDIKNKLEQDPLFPKVTIGSATADKSGKVQFKLVIQL